MLKPAAMLKARIVVLERDVEPLATALGALGVVHLKSSVDESGGQLRPEKIGERLKRCGQLMDRLQTLMQVLLVEAPREAAGAAAPAMSVDDSERLIATLEAEVAGRVKDLEAARTGLSETTELLLELEPYREVSAALAPLLGSDLLDVRPGRVAADRLGDLLSALPEGALALPISTPRTGDKKQPVDVLIVGGRRRRFELETLLEDQAVERRTMPALGDKSPAEAHLEALGKVAALRQQADDVQRDLGATGRAYAGAFQQAHSALAVQASVYEAAQSFGATWATAIVSGWVPAEREGDLRRTVSDVTHGQCVVETTPPTAEEIAGGLVPSYMPYSWLLSPFRRLVHGYGVAAYTEFEPTILFTISFLLMFGIMFGDLGQGLILVAAGLAIKKLSRSAPARDIGHVILFAGLSSALFGAFVQGTLFGKSLVEMGFRYTLGFEAINFGGESGGGGGHIMHYLLLALLLGITLMSLGMVLNVANRLRNRDYVGGVLDHFGVVGMVFYWGVLALVAKMVVYGAGPLDVWVGAVVIVVPLVLITVHHPLEALLHGHRPVWEQSPFMELFEGAIGAAETVMVYMANTFSFLRVAAFALSHAALCFTIFVLMRLVHNLPGSPVWSAIIFVVGTAVIIGLEGLIVTVQVLRLEYYEFFTKFFGGGGLPYKPFRLGSVKEAE
jgi:V/A-type H+-transporting ATPase subunit I